MAVVRAHQDPPAHGSPLIGSARPEEGTPEMPEIDGFTLVVCFHLLMLRTVGLAAWGLWTSGEGEHLPRRPAIAWGCGDSSRC